MCLLIYVDWNNRNIETYILDSADIFLKFSLYIYIYFFFQFPQFSWPFYAFKKTSVPVILVAMIF